MKFGRRSDGGKVLLGFSSSSSSSASLCVLSARVRLGLSPTKSSHVLKGLATTLSPMQDPARRDKPNSSPNGGLAAGCCCNLTYLVQLEAGVVSCSCNIYIYTWLCIFVSLWMSGVFVFLFLYIGGMC